MKSAHTPSTVRIETSSAAAHGEHKPPRHGASRSVLVLGAMGLAGALLAACGSDSDNTEAALSSNFKLRGGLRGKRIGQASTCVCATAHPA